MDRLNDQFIVDLWLLLALALVPLILGLLIGWAIGAKTGRKHVDESPHREPATHDVRGHGVEPLEPREREVQPSSLQVRSLSPSEQQQFAGSWGSIRAQFVDDPPGATREADQLTTSILRSRGFPVDDGERLAAAIATTHPSVVDDFHAVRMTRSRIESDETNTDTEELRRTFGHYQALFDEITEMDVSHDPVHRRNGSAEHVNQDSAGRIRS